jgi:hypothetical protein
MMSADRIPFLEQTIGELRSELAKVEAGTKDKTRPTRPVGPGTHWEAANLQERRSALTNILAEVTEQLQTLKRETKDV